MKEYNFDENKNIGETVRIDHIKLKLSELSEQGLTEDIDDFDILEETFDEAEDYNYNISNDMGATAEIPQRKKVKEPQEQKEVKKVSKQTKSTPPKNNPKNGGAGKAFLYVIAAVLLVVAVAGATMFAMSKAKDNQDNGGDKNADYFYGVIASVRDNKFEIIDTEEGKTGFYTIGSDAVVTKTDGRKVAYSSVSRGDILRIGLAKDTSEIVSMAYTDDVWEKENFEDVEMDIAERTISNGITTYQYDKNTIFIYNGDFVKAEDLNKEDIVTLRGIGDIVWTVDVEKYHGFIKLENVDRIENAVITIDGKKLEFVDNRAAVSAGTHSLGISGTNIDTLTVDIHITAGEIYPIDMASVQEKTGVLMLSINVEDAIIVVDGKQVSADTPIVMSLGSYAVSVSAEGYKTYNGSIDVNEPLVEIAIELEKIEVSTASITVESTPPGATVYANNAVIGITPFTTQINYGDYHISIKKDGWEDYNLSTSVNEAQKVISVLLTEE